MGLTPDEIERREFLVSLRGYDRDEVHRFLTEVAAQLRDALSAPPAEDDPYTRLGEDVAELVRSTAEQSHALRTRAEADVAALRSSAEDEVTELVRSTAEQSHALRTRAEEDVAAMRSSAEEEVAELRAQARREADEIRAAAQTEAERERNEAVDHAREQIRAVLEDARERYSRADAAERELVDYLKGVAAFAGDALHQLGDTQLHAVLDEAVGSLLERSDEEVRPPSAAY